MSKLTEALESIRSHPNVNRGIHVHRSDVIYNPETQMGWHRVTICAAHSWGGATFGDYKQFLLRVWPAAVTGPEPVETVRGHTYQRYEDGEKIKTVKDWLDEEDIQVIAGAPTEKVPEMFELERMIELHVYENPGYLRHCQEPLIPKKIYRRR